MSSALANVLEAERVARELIQAARQQAVSIATQTTSECRDLQRRCASESASATRQLRSDLARHTEEERLALVAAGRERIQSSLNIDNRAINEAVEAILDGLRTVNHDTESTATKKT